MTTAYMVTSSQYSDYHIDAVFLDRSLADELCERHNDPDDTYGSPRVREFEVVTSLPKPIVALSLRCMVTGGVEAGSSEHEIATTPGLMEGYAEVSPCRMETYYFLAGKPRLLSLADRGCR